MSNEFNVAVKVSADASQLTAELKRAGGALQEFTAQAQGGSAGVTGALQSTTTAAQAMGAVVHSGAQAQVAGAQSAAQHADALRGAAAQITNTVTTLGGLTQQGAQAGASLGTTTGAVRALVTAAGVATTGLGALAVAGGALITVYARGSAETDAYRLAIVRTGNAAGTSTSELADYAREIKGVVGTQAQAAQTLAAFTASGAVGTGMLREAAQSAIEWERATGQAASTTAAKFAALARDPLAATMKLNEGMNFLTASTYQQIKALQEQGRTSDAAAAAQHALADALSSRASEIENNLGMIERGWRGVKDMAASAWDAMLNIGREGTKSDRLQALKAELAQHQAAQAMDTRGLGMESSASVMARRGQSERAELIKNEIAALEAEIGTEQALAKVQADGAANRKLYFEWEKQGDALRTKAQQRDHAIRSAEAEGQVLLNAGLITEAQLRERIDAIREKYKDRKGAGGPKGADSELASLQAQLQAAQLYGEQLSTLGTAASALNAGERASLKIGEELKQVTDDKTAARLREKQAIADALGAQLRSNDGLKESLKIHQAAIDALNVDAEAIEQRAKAQEAANATLGKSKTAIEQLTLAELQHQMAEAQASDSVDPKYIASLELKIAAQKRYVASLEGADYKAAEQHVNELLRGAQELSKAYEDEQQLSGLTALEREKIVARRQVELKYAKELAAIDRSAYTEAEKQTLRDGVNAAKRDEIAAAEAKAQAQYMARASDEINRSLTDALMRGFESGKGMAENLADTTKNLFNSMVLRPVLSAIVTPVSLAINGIVQQGLSAVGLGSGSGGNILGLASNASSAYNLATGSFGSALFGNAAAYGAMTPGLAIGGQQAAMLAAQTGEFGLAGATATAQAGGAGMGGFGALLSNPLAIAGGALLLGNALGLFRKTEKRGAGLIGTLGEAGGVHDADLMRKSGTLFGGPDWFVEDRGKSALDKAVQAQWTASLETVKSWTSALSLSTDKIDGFSTTLGNETLGDHGQLGIRLDKDGTPLSDAEVQAKINDAIRTGNNDLAEQIIGTWETTTQEVTERIKTGFGEGMAFEDVTKTVERTTYVASEFAHEGERAIDTLDRLGGSLMSVNALFEQTGQALYANSLAGGAGASDLVDQFGGRDQFNAVASAYVQNFYPAADLRAKIEKQLSEELAKIDLKLPDTFGVDAREQWRQMAAAQDLSTESGRKAWATLLQLSDSFAQLTPAAGAFNAAVSGMGGTIKGILDNAMKADSAGAASQQASEAFQSAILDSITGALTTSLGDMISQSLVAPLMDSLLAGATASSATLAAGGAAAAGSLAAGGAYAAGANAQGGAAAASALASGGSSAASAMVSGGAATGTLVASVVDQARAQIAAMGQILMDPDVQAGIKDISAAVGGLAGDLYSVRQSFGGGGGGSFTSAASSAQDSTDKLAESLRNLGDKAADEVKRLRGLMVEDSPQSREVLLARFATSTAAARAGDQDALKLLPELSRAVEAATAASATSAIEVARMRGWLAGSLSQTLGTLNLDVPQFAVGTNRVPRDMLALIHEGEAIVPKPFNPETFGAAFGTGGGADSAELQGLRMSFDRFAEAQLDSSLNGQRLLLRAVRVLEQWERNGTPQPRTETWSAA